MRTTAWNNFRFGVRWLSMRRTLMVASAFIALTTTTARAADYSFDPVHTTATFTVTHLAISKVHGQIPVSTGTLSIGPNDLPTGGTVAFNMTQLNSQDENRDKSLKSPSYLDTAKFPTMTFVVRKVDGTPQSFTMTGDLTLHGVTKSVMLKGSEVGSAVIKGERQVGYTATTAIDRRDFGIDFASFTGGSLVVGYEVDIDVEVAAQQKAATK